MAERQQHPNVIDVVIPVGRCGGAGPSLSDTLRKDVKKTAGEGSAQGPWVEQAWWTDDGDHGGGKSGVMQMG